ncbi:MAG: fibrinogen-like YCDxxxxGGGW domain-containing protein [Myxococcota bacterium]
MGIGGWVVALAAGCGQGSLEVAETDQPNLAEGSSSSGAATTTPPPASTTSTTAPPPTASATTADPGTTLADGTDAAETSTGDCVTVSGYRDLDDDGFGDPAAPVEACTVLPEDAVANADDCDDDDPDAYPNAPEYCGGTADTNCDDALPPVCASCVELLTGGQGTQTGQYTIDVDGDAGPEAPLQVYCDQDTAGGGWTLVQRTVWDPALTDALQTTYVQWRTLTVGDPGSSGAYRLRGDLWDDLQSQYDHLLRVDLRVAADGGSCAPLFYQGSGGVLTVNDDGTTLEGLTSDVSIISGTAFSTTDLGPSTSCVVNSDAVPWFYGSCCATCPRYQGSYWNEPHPMLSYTNSVADMFGNQEPDVCSTPAAAAINGSSYRGANAMAYFIR